MNIQWSPSPNYTPASRSQAEYGQPRTFKEIAIHWWGDPKDKPTFDGTVAWLRNANRPGRSSAHYVVSDTKIAQLVKEEDVSWATSSANPFTISIEIDPNTPGKTYETVGKLVADIRKRRGHMPLVPHNKYMPTQCPGTIDLATIDILAEGGDYMDLADKYGAKSVEELDKKIFEHVGLDWGNANNPENKSFLAIDRRWKRAFEDEGYTSVQKVKDIIEGHKSQATKFENKYIKANEDLAVEKEKHKLAKESLAVQEEECQTHTNSLIARINELSRDYPDVEKLRKEYESQLAEEQKSVNKWKDKYQKQRIENARLSTIKTKSFMEKLLWLFL